MSQSVTIIDAVSGDGNRSGTASDDVPRQTVIEPAANSVSQVVDAGANLMVRQVLDEANLRRRAYFHTLDLTKGAPTRLRATDRRA